MNQPPEPPAGKDEDLTFHLAPRDGDGASAGLRAGDVCPRCRQARLDYDGMLNLTCEHCHFIEGGCFT